MHNEFMQLALDLAEKANPAPNPKVGAVLVKDGTVISTAFHERPGLLHAEALAIQQAGDNAKGGTLYVTLEPCCHRKTITGTAKRTPPCTETIIHAGVSSVFVASLDPNPMVAGKGVKRLLDAGISVKTGLLENQEKMLNREYHYIQRCGLPWVHVKQAVSQDGYIAGMNKDSSVKRTKLTSSDTDIHVHSMRYSYQAILAAAGTIRCDNPYLTVRYINGTSPVRIILDDSKGLNFSFNVFRDDGVPVYFVTDHYKCCISSIPKHIHVIHENPRNLATVLKLLACEGIVSILAEAGSSLISSLIEDNLVCEYSYFRTPVLLGRGLKVKNPVSADHADVKNETQWITKAIISFNRDTLTTWIRKEALCLLA